MTNFKIAIVTIFTLGLVIGIAIFALSKASSTPVAQVVVWGTIPDDAFSVAYKNSTLPKNKSVSVRYVRKDKADFDADFVEALASGTGPDVVILREDSMFKHRNKFLMIPYKSYPERNFKDTFIEGGEIFLSTDGIQALPLMIDPMVMYWNRDMFTTNLISQPPQYWDDVLRLVPTLTRKDKSGNIMQSMLSFGEWRNVANAKEILATLLLQGGTPIISYNKSYYTSVLDSQLNYPIAPGQSALNFYTQFSNPTAAMYTWNRSLPSSLNFFLSGNLATYFGFASELFSIQQKNPNLNFDVTYMPQARQATKKIVFAYMYGLAITKQSKSIAGAFATILGLTEPSSLTALETMTNLPPVRRDLLAAKPTDAYRTVFYNSALYGKAWTDPDPQATSEIFKEMVESVTSGRARVTEALGRASQLLSTFLTQ